MTEANQPQRSAMDAERLLAAGLRLVDLAADIPELPTVVATGGGDPLSAALGSRIGAVEQGLSESLHALKTDAFRAAQSIIDAAGTHGDTDGAS